MTRGDKTVCKIKSQDNRKESIDKLIKEDAFDEVYQFVKRKIMYLHVALDNYNFIFASTYENYYSFARISPAFTNMIEQSIFCGVYTNLAELIHRNTVVGIQTLTKIAREHYGDDVKEKSNEIIEFIKEKEKMLADLIRLRNKEICHFDQNVLSRNTVAQNASCLNIKELKEFLNGIEDRVSQLRLACKKDGVYETMCPINSLDSNILQSILDTFLAFKPEIMELKRQKKIELGSDSVAQ